MRVRPRSMTTISRMTCYWISRHAMCWINACGQGKDTVRKYERMEQALDSRSSNKECNAVQAVSGTLISLVKLTRNK
jgi:hypothetical protein